MLCSFSLCLASDALLEFFVCVFFRSLEFWNFAGGDDGLRLVGTVSLLEGLILVIFVLILTAMS